ncbi:MAG: hypothetical protein ACYSOR_00940 [Planctomycetota bacterium]|jgi:hypothetical protein
MKTKKTIGFMLAVCLISAVVMAQASGDKKADPKGADASVSRQRPEGAPPVSPRRRGDPRNRQQAYQEMLEKRGAIHKEAVAELEAIKKIAEEEGAKRTVEALQMMIDKKNAEFKQRMEQFETQRRERSKQLEQRTGGRPQRNGPAGPAESKMPAEK